MIRAGATYKHTYPNGDIDVLIVDVSTDATYTPDLLSDLAGKARTTLADSVADYWPTPVVEP